jgi:hypothetical protein
MPELSGSALALLLYDVCEEIDLGELDRILGGKRLTVPPRRQAPEYVRYQRPPAIEQLDAIELDGGQKVGAELKYYDYGVVSITIEMPFKGSWDGIIQLATTWIASTEFEKVASAIIRQKLERAKTAIIKANPDWLMEDYFVFHLVEADDANDAETLLAKHGAQIAQMVRGESLVLAKEEKEEVLRSCLSYYPTDLTVIGWHAAFIFDTTEGADMAIHLLEYANSQLLEFRHYDELLTRELEVVYKSLDRGTGLRLWRLVRQANRLQTVALEVTELTERADNAIKFLRDMFSARLYRLAAEKVGVLDYEDLVNRKLRMADELYRSITDQFQQARTFLLESMVVLILLIELSFLFRGK